MSTSRSPKLSEIRRRRVYAGLLVLQVAVALRFLLDRSPGTDAAAVGLPLDDAWIHLVYARSLAGMHGFAFIPGQAEAGFTSPLWAMILAPLFWIRLPWDVSLVLMVKVVGVACSFAAAVFGCRLGEKLAGLGAGAVLGAMLVIDPWLAFGAVSGMEVPLALATCLAAFSYLAQGRFRPAGIAFALALWSRPEMFVVVALSVFVLAWSQRGDSRLRGTLRDLAGPPGIALALFLLYCVVVTGRFLPPAFYLKHQEAGWFSSFADVRAVFVDQLFDYPWLFAGSGLVAFGLGAMRLLRPQPAGADARAVRIALIAAGPVWMLAIAWAHRVNEPLAFYWHRYLDAGIGLVFVPIAVGLWSALAALLRFVRRAPSQAGSDKAQALLAMPLLALALYTLPAKLERDAEQAAWGAENIQGLQVQVALWLAHHSEPNDWIATHDPGAICFLSGRPVIDMLGINTHRVLVEGLPAVLRTHRPRYLAIIPAWYPRLVSRLTVVHRVHVDHFVVCAHCQQDTMVVLRP